MYCKNCGKEICDNDMFCPFCGVKQDNEEDLQTQPKSEQKNHTSNKITNLNFKKLIKLLPKIGFYSSLAGIGIFLLIVFIGLIFYGKVYLYNGYSFTKFFCTISVILMLLGSVTCGGYLTYKIIKKEIMFDKQIIIRICVVVLSIIFSIVSLSNAASVNEKHHSTNSFSSSSSMSAYTYALLYLDITNVKTTHNSSYTICTGTIRNTGNKSVRYIKIRGAFQNYSGTTIDTDWTYAVGSEWLSPGESTTFRLSVSKDTSITKCSVTFMS